VAYSPDEKRLATAGEDNTAKVWDAESGKELLTLGGHLALFTVLPLAPMVDASPSASEDRTVQVYALDISELLTVARSRVIRTLTAGECQRYFQSETCPPLL
jgi:WD40 repeat protein